MRTRRIVAALAACVTAGLVAGCGAGYGQSKPARSASAYSPPSAEPAYSGDSAGEAYGGDYDSDYGGGSEGGFPDAVDTGSEPVARDERPGLGTRFGEQVSSNVVERPFDRHSASPFARVAMFYNDADGVRAQIRFRGADRLLPVHAYTPHGGISIALTDPYGNVLPGGEASGRTYVVGADGQRYNIVIQNDTGGRYEVVASVDGLDVIDGRPADTAKRGYILPPYGRLVIDGFRTSDSSVAAFRFGAVSESYAARTSGDRNVGVVGLAFFAERGSVWTNDELRRRETADPFPGDRAYARPPM